MLSNVQRPDSVLDSPGSSPEGNLCVVFLGKTLYSHSASDHPGVLRGTSELFEWAT